MTDRSIAPRLKDIGKVELLPLHEHKLNNNSMVYSIPDAAHPLFQLYLVFPAGKWHEPHNGVANFTARLLTEGTASHSAAAIAEKIDSLGAEISVTASHDHTTIKVTGLTRHYEALLTIVAELITDPIFPEEELALKKKISLQQLLVNEQKVDFLASRKFTETLFGADHPYGYKLHRQAIEAIDRQAVVQFHKDRILQQPFMAFVSGMVPHNFTILLEQALGHINPAKKPLDPELTDVVPTTQPQEVPVEKPNTKQSALRLGKYLYNPFHEDHHNMQILTTILGGYFGSRLMANIREDKGFTYGIFSTVQSYKNSAFLYIATEVGCLYQNAALLEIYKELKKLQDEKVDPQELQLVKNYMMGSVLNGIDGPHKAVKVFKGLITNGKDAGTFKKFVDRIQNITAEELLITARKYFSPESFLEVIAGPKSEDE
jgi:predicted Zn-dependent peptidase